MEACRICLKEKSILYSVYDTFEKTSFLFMITYLSKIKMEEYETINKICSLCRKQLIAAYNFVLLIGSSDETLRSTGKIKKIYFNNLDDIKVKIEISEDKGYNFEDTIFDNFFKEGGQLLSYHNTIIKKINQTQTKMKNAVNCTQEKKFSIVDFFNNFGNELQYEDFVMDDNNITVSDDDKDEDFVVPLSAIKKQTLKNKHFDGRTRRKNKKLKEVLIKPVMLKDIKIVYSIKKKPKVKKKYKRSKICQYCGKMSSNLKSHISNKHTGDKGEPIHKCDVCNKAFLTSNYLLKHRQNHDANKHFKCDHCIAAFNCKQLLISHMQSHSDIKIHACDICSKSFKRKGALNRHRRIHNIANKCVRCHLCNMSFYDKGGLKHHLRVHTRERPYNCEICSQPYSYKHDFNRHCFKKHGVFLKRRIVYVMNEEVLKRERALMRDLMLRVHGCVKDEEPLNPFEMEGPQAALAFEQAVKALETNKILVDINY